MRPLLFITGFGILAYLAYKLYVSKQDYVDYEASNYLSQDEWENLDWFIPAGVSMDNVSLAATYNKGGHGSPSPLSVPDANYAATTNAIVAQQNKQRQIAAQSAPGGHGV